MRNLPSLPSQHYCEVEVSVAITAALSQTKSQVLFLLIYGEVGNLTESNKNNNKHFLNTFYWSIKSKTVANNSLLQYNYKLR